MDLSSDKPGDLSMAVYPSRTLKPAQLEVFLMFLKKGFLYLGGCRVQALIDMLTNDNFFIVLFLGGLLFSGGVAQARPSQGSELSLGYVGLNYPSDKIFGAGTKSGYQSGMSMRYVRSWSPAQDSNYWGLALLAMMDFSSNSAVQTYALNFDAKHFFGEAPSSGWYVFGGLGLAISVVSSGNQQSAQAAASAGVVAAGSSHVGADFTGGAGYSIPIGEKQGLGIGAGFTFLMIAGGVIPAENLLVSFFF